MKLWINWLKVACVVVAVFGIAIAVFPDLGSSGFSLLIYGDDSQIDSFGAQSSRYISFVHAVLGCTMFGWASALFLVVTCCAGRELKLVWNIFFVSIASWFILDTSISLVSGFWQNAVLNTLFAVMFAIPLIALKKTFK